MSLTRRDFLRRSGLAAAYIVMPAWLSACAGEAAQPGRANAERQLAQPDLWAATPLAADPILHLINRITYGPRPGDLARTRQMGWEAFLDQQLHPAQIDDSKLDQRLAALPTLSMSNAALIAGYPKAKDAAPGQPGSQAIVRELETASLLRAIFSERQLFEIMVDFWSNHLNVSIGKQPIHWLKTSDDREVIRPHALGKFRDLLIASAKSPAMLVYLDNAANVAPTASGAARGRGLNENYAREVMELHTVGSDGGYTQADITTVARILTGWTVTGRQDANPGTFVFRARWHDSGAKRIDFLDLSLPEGGGIEEGEALLAALAAHPRTAERIAGKLCAAFVADEPPPDLVARAAQAYQDHDTDISAVLGLILRSDAFKAGAEPKIKLPLRLLVSALRATAATVEQGSSPRSRRSSVLEQLTNLGQPFFGWPSPNGYPQSSAAWINTGGMLSRWNLAFALAEGRIGGVTDDRHSIYSHDPLSAVELVDRISGWLTIPLSANTHAVVSDYASGGTDPRAPLNDPAIIAQDLIGLLLASPAFQLHTARVRKEWML
jgi:uncharacterized protein (DUF1800 family)